MDTIEEVQVVREDMKAQNKLVDQLYNTDEELQLGGWIILWKKNRQGKK